MSVTIIMGGQFGSEGKGKIAHYFAQKEKADYRSEERRVGKECRL